MSSRIKASARTKGRKAYEKGVISGATQRKWGKKIKEKSKQKNDFC